MLTRVLIFFFTFFMLAIAAIAQPKIVVSPPGEINFGDAYVGSKVTRDVLVKNIGSDTLHIDNIRAECGCTATLMTERFIPPGDSAALSVTFDSKGYNPGKATKSVTIESDDPANGRFVVKFFTNVIQLLHAQPDFFSFSNAVLDSVYKKTVIITNPSDVPITIKSYKSMLTQVSLALNKNKLMPGEKVELEATFIPRRAGQYSSNVEIETDHPTQPKFEIRILAWVNRK